jgi:WD40 repeat protein
MKLWDLSSLSSGGSGGGGGSGVAPPVHAPVVAAAAVKPSAVVGAAAVAVATDAIAGLATIACLHTFSGHNHWVRALAVTEDGYVAVAPLGAMKLRLTTTNRCLISGSYNLIRIFDLNGPPYTCTRTLNVHFGSFYNMIVCVFFGGGSFGKIGTHEPNHNHHILSDCRIAPVQRRV